MGGLLRALFLLPVLLSATGQAADIETVSLVLLEYAGDPRYRESVIDQRYQAQPWGRLDEAAELAIRESRFTAEVRGVRFELDRRSVERLDELPQLVRSLEQSGTTLLLLDLPADGIEQALQGVRSEQTILFNLSALDNRLRDESCRANLLHIAPSRRMLTDAMAQYLVSKKWRDLLVLYGESDADRHYLESLEASAKKFGLKIVDQRWFQLGNDPRQRYQNSIALLTAKGEYDLIYVVDSRGEFAVDLPYGAAPPRPVVGSAGLVADWWHWAWERNGAPQVNKRFRRRTNREMTGYDWSAWLAVKTIAEAVSRQPHYDPRQLRSAILNDQLTLDGAKGYPLNFRPWNNQLRQPVFLSTWNRVIARAPVDGFLHSLNNLDTLGHDRAESRCVLQPGGGS